jgi:hypothetical protein
MYIRSPPFYFTFSVSSLFLMSLFYINVIVHIPIEAYANDCTQYTFCRCDADALSRTRCPIGSFWHEMSARLCTWQSNTHQ